MVSENKVFILNDLGNVERTFSIVRDTAKQPDIERQLCETQNRFNIITNQDFMGIIITQDGLTRYQNTATTKITGFSLDDRSQWGKDENLCMIYPADRERIIEQFKQDQNNPDMDSLKLISYRIVTKSGDVKYVDDYSKRIQFNGKEAWLTMLLDTTEKHHLQEDYFKNQIIESVGVLAGGIAHDFNNLLTGILGNISLAKIEIENKEQQPLYEILEESEKAAIRATHLTQQLLSFSKGCFPIRKNTNIVPMIKDTSQFVLRGSNIQLHYKIAPDIPMVYADSGQISQVIQNLVLNAKQTMPSGGNIIISINSILGIKWKTKIGIDPARKYVEIIVADEGPGISLENLSRIFDPYFTTKKSGSGLGLAISYSIVKKHSGMMWVESKLGEGTNIYVVIPVINGT